jgi:hypothetical protein
VLVVIPSTTVFDNSSSACANQRALATRNKQNIDRFPIPTPQFCIQANLSTFDMAASDIQNPPAPVESKSAKKKKAKAQAERTESPAPVASTPERAASVAAGEAQDEGDNAYIRDLQKWVNPDMSAHHSADPSVGAFATSPKRS